MLSSGDSIWYLAKLLAAMSKTKDLIQTPVPDFSFVFGDRNLPVPTQWLTRTRAYPGPGRASAEGVPELGCYVGVLSKPVAILVQSGGHHVNA